MKKDNRHTAPLPHEDSLRDEGLSRLFARLSQPEPSSPEVKWEIMSRIREADMRRKRCAKLFFYISLAVVYVLGGGLAFVLLGGVVPVPAMGARGEYSVFFDVLSRKAVFLVPGVFFFYLFIDLWLSQRRMRKP